MNVLKAIRVAELRKKLSVIPAKIIIAVILTYFCYWDKSFEMTFKDVIQDPKKSLLSLVLVYGIVSYVHFFIRLMHNWFFGVLISIGVAALVIAFVPKLGDVPYLIAIIVMIFGGPVLDIITLIRYHSLKNQVIRAEEEHVERSYGDGYDEGFRSGMREGRMDERSRMREEYEYEDRLYERERRRRMDARDEYDRVGRGDDRYDGYDNGYDDRYDDGYLGEDEGYYRDGSGEGYDEGYGDGYYEESGNGYDRMEDSYEEAPRITRGDSENAAGFFADCKTPGEIKRRYHDLCKVYHPDSGCGSAEIFYRIKSEYDRLSAKS